jgi:hypothetical protein
MAATTTLLGLVTPTQGTLSGTWGDTVNYGISDYVDIAIAGTLTFSGDGAITLANTLGSASGNGITSTTAQYMVIRVTGTQTVAKVITGPSYSKLYMVDHAGATSAVTFKAAGQTGVSIAVGEKCFVYYNGIDYVKVASSTADGVTTIDFGSTGLTPNTATSGAVTVAGTLAVANGGTGLTAGTSGGVLAYTATGTLASSAALTANALVIGGGAGVAPSTTTTGTGVLTFLGTPSSANLAAAVTDETGSGALVFATSPTLVTPVLGTPSSGVLSSCTVDGTNKVGYLNIPQSGSSKTTSYTLVVGDVGEYILLGASGAIVIPDATFAAGDVVTIFNNTASTATITCSITTAYIAGTFTDKATMTLAAAGVATVLFITSTLCVVSGNVT